MKTMMKRVMLAVAVIAVCGVMNAQEAKKQRPTREQATEMRANRIAEKLALGDEAGKKFVEAYCACQKEIRALNVRADKQDGRKVEAKSEAEVGKELEQQFERRRQVLDIQQKYYKEYSRFLTQKQIKRVYELEKQQNVRPGKRNGDKRAPMDKAGSRRPLPQEK